MLSIVETETNKKSLNSNDQGLITEKSNIMRNLSVSTNILKENSNNVNMQQLHDVINLEINNKDNDTNSAEKRPEKRVKYLT